MEGREVMASCPKCGKKMMQEAEACDVCWLKSDLAEAEKRIAELSRKLDAAQARIDDWEQIGRATVAFIRAVGKKPSG
jgi:hypothetical protein